MFKKTCRYLQPTAAAIVTHFISTSISRLLHAQNRKSTGTRGLNPRPLSCEPKAVFHYLNISILGTYLPIYRKHIVYIGETL